MKNWILENKFIIPFFALFLLAQVINKFGDLNAQLAKIEIAFYLILIYIPFFVLSFRKLKYEKINFSIILILSIPIIFEFLTNEYHQNRTNIAYYDLSLMTASVILLMYFIAIDKTVDQKNIILANLIFITAAILIIITILNIYFNFDGVNINKGRFITGNQNISAYILLISLPFLMPLMIRNYYKVAYIILVFFIIAFIYKSRIPTIISFLYGIYTIYTIYQTRDKKAYLFIASFVTLSIAVVIFIFNDRFHNLISYDIYFRLLPLLRIYNSLDINNLVFGVGTGNLAAFLYSNQDKYAVLELMLPADAFTYAHNFLIDRLVSAGIFVFLLYLALYIFIISRYIKIKDKSLYLKSLFHAFVIGLLISFYDIVHNTFSGYSIFTLITGLLFLNLYTIQKKFNKYLFLILFIFLLTPLVFYKHNNIMGHHHDYNNIINLINSGKDAKSQISTLSMEHPHYAEIDSLITYQKYFQESLNANEPDFKVAFFNMNKFNKYRNSRLHFSSQYYASKNFDNDLIDVYSDIIYRSLVLKKVVNPLHNSKNMIFSVVNSGHNNIEFISRPCCTLNIPKDMFKQIKFVNSGVTTLKITDESIDFVAANTIYSIDSEDVARDTLIVKEFLREINKFSEPLKF